MMKKVILFFTVFALLYSCSNPENDIEKYLKENTPMLNSLEFVEVSEIDSVYSPLDELFGASLWCTEARSVILKAWGNSTEYNFKEKVSAVEDSLKAGYDRVMEILINTERVLNMREFDVDVDTHNRRGIKAKYRINGRLRTDWFYYDKDGEIHSSTIDVERYYKDISDCIIEYGDDVRNYKRSWH